MCSNTLKLISKVKRKTYIFSLGGELWLFWKEENKRQKLENLDMMQEEGRLYPVI